MFLHKQWRVLDFCDPFFCILRVEIMYPEFTKQPKVFNDDRSGRLPCSSAVSNSDLVLKSHVRGTGMSKPQQS